MVRLEPALEDDDGHQPREEDQGAPQHLKGGCVSAGREGGGCKPFAPGRRMQCAGEGGGGHLREEEADVEQGGGRDVAEHGQAEGNVAAEAAPPPALGPSGGGDLGQVQDAAILRL